MENIRYDLITALPEIILLGMAMLVLITDLFLNSLIALLSMDFLSWAYC